tara:strand:- start:970 stop:1950 length:981 start_codon:yes stop_codon:yes gene_type:complete
MHILLTGGAGYIGSHVVLDLLDKGHQVFVIDDLSTGNKELIPSSVNFVNCNVNDNEKITNIISNNNFDILMHFAGFIQVEESVEKPLKYFENNTDNSIKLFKNCIKNNLNKIIFSSTASVYGYNELSNNILEETNLKPNNPYAESKLRAEKYLLSESNLNFIILRYFNVAGADSNMRTGLVSKKSTHLIKILSEVIAGKKSKIKIYGNDYSTKDGTAIRDFIHVSDLADVHTLCAEQLYKNNISDIFNCGYGKGYSVLEVIQMANKIYNNVVKYEFTNRRPGDVEKLVANNNKINNFIDWKPKYNNLEKIIMSSVKWEKYLDEQNF